MKLFLVNLLLVFLVSGSGAIFAQEDTIPGRIAYIGEDYNVYTYSPATDETVALTQDADNTHRYQYPAWSTDGRLAFFCCDPQFQNDLQLAVSVVAPDLATTRVVYTAENESFTYAYWSPANCEGQNCRDLAVLISRPGNAFKVELVRDFGEKASNTTIGVGAPFYFSWSPDGTRLLRHTDYLTLDVYSAKEARVTSTLSVVGSDFPAPAWSPVDDRILVGTLNERRQGSDLILIDGNENRIIRSGIRGTVAFNWSPDGTYIAYRIVSGRESSLTVVRAADGEVVSTVNNELIVAFFWSPDSQRIAYTAVSEGPRGFDASITRQQALNLDWMMLDISAGLTGYLTTFAPTVEMTYMLLYFDQFAQSHRVWSPDSDYLVYGEDKAGDSYLSVLDTTRLDAVPFTVAKGVMGTWSYE